MSEDSGIGEITQSASEELTANRGGLAAEEARINAEEDLSDSAKQRYIDAARAKAQANYEEIIDNHDQSIADKLERNEKRLFELSYGSGAVTDSQKETYRASYRQAALQLLGADEETISRAMSRAYRTGDKVLEQAAYHETIERGLSEIGDEYRARYSKAAADWDVYVRDRRAAESRDQVLYGSLMKMQDPAR
jgi:hypothetical protein